MAFVTQAVTNGSVPMLVPEDVDCWRYTLETHTVDMSPNPTEATKPEYPYVSIDFKTGQIVSLELPSLDPNVSMASRPLTEAYKKIIETFNASIVLTKADVDEVIDPEIAQAKAVEYAQQSGFDQNPSVYLITPSYAYGEPASDCWSVTLDHTPGTNELLEVCVDFKTSEVGYTRKGEHY